MIFVKASYTLLLLSVGSFSNIHAFQSGGNRYQAFLPQHLQHQYYRLSSSSTTTSKRRRSRSGTATPTSITKSPTSKLSETTSSSDTDPLSELSDERKDNLFQALLRDLQIEGVPVLACDAEAVHTMSAALWTTMAEMSENDDEAKVCLVMESIPLGALQAFVDDFTVLKTQERLMVGLPELRRISASLVGKGVGPGLVIESSARTDEEKAEKNARSLVTFDEAKCQAALKSFIDRVVVNKQACPYTKSINLAAVGLEARGVPPGPVGYRFSASSDAAAAVGTFWNCVCELLSTPQEQISTTMLSLPGIGFGESIESLQRFAAVMELVSRNLCLFRGDDVFGLVHFHPAYDRSEIHPIDKPAYGHLPPRSWLVPMMKLNGNIEEATSFTEDDLKLSDYQRKSPFTAINILRVNQLNAANGAKSIVDLEVSEGVTEKASGITTYSRNAITLATTGKEALEAGLQADIAITK